MPTIQKIVKVTKAQMASLINGSTIAGHTYDPTHCLYMVDDGLDLPEESGRYFLTTDDDGDSYSYELADDSAGSTTQPIYFNNGIPTPTTYALNATVPSNAVFTDTKNTTGSTNSDAKLFIVGAGEQSANPQTYSNSKVYTQSGKLYSNSKEVLTAHATHVVTVKSGKKSDGSTDISANSGDATSGNMTVTLGDSGVTAGTYRRVTVNAKGIVVAGDQTDADSDTKNTAGSTNSSSKLFLIGAAEQSANPQTYSNSSVYTQSGKLYSNNKEVSVEGHTHSQYLTAHPTITKETDTTSTASPAHGGTFTVIDSVTRETNGHVTKINTKTVTLPSDNDTKNTAGSSNSTSKLFLIGASSQNASGVTTYSNSAVYATAGQLDATKFRVAEKATMQYNSTEDCVEFIFA